ncbi:MAG TPA: archease [Oceanithermus profundus]|uniref:Archease n=1 Tax=Oceanithermus profundus TaxID=187137 RepID=A0A7C4ZF93_9DEIN|nr:archease [Oceanithermus profundus]
MRLRMLDHTADVGFEVEAGSLPALFEGAAKGLLQVMFEGPLEAEPGDEHRLRLEAESLETLLVRWLDELAYLVQTRGEVPLEAEVSLDRTSTGWRLEARLATAPFDRVADRFAGEVKAATYHGLEIKQTGDRYRARVILDV